MLSIDTQRHNYICGGLCEKKKHLNTNFIEIFGLRQLHTHTRTILSAAQRTERVRVRAAKQDKCIGRQTKSAAHKNNNNNNDNYNNKNSECSRAFARKPKHTRACCIVCVLRFPFTINGTHSLFLLFICKYKTTII